MQSKAREGDFIETSEGSLFDVKGLIHPPNRIVAFLRYFPDKRGKRKRRGISYSKVYSLSKRYALLKKRYPQYLLYDPIFDEKFCEVSVNAIREHHKPAEKLRQLRQSNQLDRTETLSLRLAQLVKETADIPWEAIGISGSIMVGLHKPDSDIDPVVYGSENCRKVHALLKRLLKEKQGLLKPYTRKGLKDLFDFRSRDTLMSYEDFVRIESRKVMQGKFSERDYFIRLVKDWSEVEEKYGDVCYVNVGYARVKAIVVDDSESIFTPCMYKVSDVRLLEGSQIGPIREIVSFRGRFCEQARDGEEVVAQGKVERVKHRTGNLEYFRLLLGNKPSDFMILA